jgi:hypothetical protein
VDATPFITAAFKHGMVWGTLAGLLVGFWLGVIYSHHRIATRLK